MARRLVVLVAALAAIHPPLEAQYFGKNRVQYRHLDFAVIETEHFDVYYYEGERAAALAGARMAERTYGHLSRLLNHRYRERQPIILFASHSEFQQNNVTSISEGTGGVTEPFRHRVLLPFTGSYAEFEHVLRHEIVHQFQFDVFARGHVGGGIQRLVAVQPPLWFMEGMAEYLALGPITPQTAMWLRDAVRHDRLPTIDALTHDPRVSPYRFGHALWSYVAERWGDRRVGELLRSAAVWGVAPAFERVLGTSLETLIADWHEAIRRRYLPQLNRLTAARDVAAPSLTRARSEGTLHLSPTISPDGRRIAYLSEGGSYFINLYVADAETGAVERRLARSAFSADFESLRFLKSAGSWSRDGRYFAIAVKHGARDDIVVFDLDDHGVERRIEVPLHGVTNPSWAPDGERLVFTGHDGGLTDLFVIDADGTDLRRLTNDPFADLHPSWSPDGRTIAFVTDRGPKADLDRLRLGPTRLAFYDVASGGIRLAGAGQAAPAGNDIDPQWAPDGRSVAFVSERTGVPNLFLYDRDDGLTYQLTSLATGIGGLTPLSPAISWAPAADRLVFTYYEAGEFNVYVLDEPRRLKGFPYDADAWTPRIAAPTSGDGHGAPSGRAAGESAGAPRRIGRRLLTFTDGGRRTRRTAPDTISVRELLDSMSLELPDTGSFGFRDYSASLSPDFVIQPSIGYQRDNFGSGIFGGSAISLSDMLGNHRLLLATQINGRLDEAQFLAVYADLSRRINWRAGISQTPYFFFTGSGTETDARGTPVVTTRLERFVVREAFARALRPFNRFRRVELGARAVNLSRAAVDFVQSVDPEDNRTRFDREVVDLGGASYVQPSVALVHDNAISLWVGPIMGRRSRFEYAPAIGGWEFHQILADYRRYDPLFGPFTFASRFLFFGRFGRDDDQFPLFLGIPELLRGYTAGSLRRNECRSDIPAGTRCQALDQLVGSRMAVLNAELRFPIWRPRGAGRSPWLPPLEGALFFDAGLAWRDGSRIVLHRAPGTNTSTVRTPLYAVGASLRGNFFGFLILRADYAKPLSRAVDGPYLTLSLGPTF